MRIGPRSGEDGGRGLARNTVILAGSRLSEQGAGFVVALLVAKFRGTSGLGIYATGWAVYSLTVLIAQSGLREYVARELSRWPDRTSSYITHLCVAAGVCAVALIALAEAVVPFLGYSHEARVSVAVVLLAALPKVLNSIQEAVFVAHRRVEFEFVPRACGFAVYLGVSAWLLASHHRVSDIFVAFVITEYVVTLVYFVIVGQWIVELSWRLERALMRRLTLELRPFAASAGLAALVSRPEILILSLVATESQVGIYGAASRLAELPLVLTEVFLSNAFPLLSATFERDEGQFARWQATAVHALLAFALPVAAVTAAVPGEILRLLFGQQFGAGATALRILAAYFVCYSLIGLLWRTLVARHLQRANVQIQCLTVLPRLGCGVALSALAGATGAAVASVTVSLVHAALLQRAAVRAGAPLRLTTDTAKIALAALVTGLVVYWVARAGGLALGLVGGTLVYVLACWLFGLHRLVRRGVAVTG